MVIRCLVVLPLLAWSIPCFGGINESAERPVQEPTAAMVAANEAARQALIKPLPDLEFSRTTLSAAIATLREQTEANIFVNWKALGMVGVDRNVVVSVSLHGKNLRNALEVLLTLAGADRDACGLAVDEGVITVTSQDDLNKNVEVRVYDARDVIGHPTAADRQRRVDALVHLIEDQIDTPSWKDHGGSVGAIRELEGQLIVTQTPANQAKVMKLLKGVGALLADAERR